jgi:hypothetical protein
VGGPGLHTLEGLATSPSAVFTILDTEKGQG